MKTPTSHTQSKVIVTAVIAALFIALYVAGVLYIKHVYGIVARQAQELSLEVARERSMHDLGGFLKELAGEGERLNDFFVKPEDAVTTIERVEGLGAVIGAPVSISGVRIEDENPDTGEGTLAMVVSAGGTWRQVMLLATLLDTLPFTSSVKTLSLSASGGEEGSEVIWSLRGTLLLSLRK